MSTLKYIENFIYEKKWHGSSNFVDVHIRNEADTDSNLAVDRTVEMVIATDQSKKIQIMCVGILSLYITEMLMYDERETKIIYHTFAAAFYIFPLFGGILADSWLGKYRTVLQLSLVCVVGNVVLAISAVKPLQLPEKVLGMVALTLIAIGTAGIKSSLLAFGRDQFNLPKETKEMDAYFHFFYFIINIGSFISLLIAPLLRRRVSCLGQDTCYPLAFFVPAVLMVLAIAVFRAGKPLYKVARPEGSMLVRLVRCVCTATRNKLRMRGVKKDHWLDYALEEYGEEVVSDTKTVLSMFLVFLPLPIFWALFEQQSTTWIFQARHLNGQLGKYFTILPDQMLIVNPTLVLMFIPICRYIVYPVLSIIKMVRKPLQRVAAGGILAAIAFVFTAWLQYEIENFDNTMQLNQTQAHIYNLFLCDVQMASKYLQRDLHHPDFEISTMEVYSILLWGGATRHAIVIKSRCNNVGEDQKADGDIPFKGEKKHFLCWSTAVNATYQCKYLESPTMPTGSVYVRAIANLNKLYPEPIVIRFYDSSGYLKLEFLSSDHSHHDIAAGQYGVEFGCSMRYSAFFDMGGVYMIAAYMETEDNYLVKQFTIVPPRTIPMLYILPQYVAMTLAEVMLIISGLQFAQQEAPEHLIPVIRLGWLFSIGIGQLVVVAIEAINFFDKESSTHILYACIMAVDMCVFYLITVCDYQYQNLGSRI